MLSLTCKLTARMQIQLSMDYNIATGNLRLHTLYEASDTFELHRLARLVVQA